MELGLISPPPVTAAAAALCVLLGVTVPVATEALKNRSFRRNLNLPPAVPGLPIVGNLHQLTEKKPHRTFASWAETYGPVFSIKTGASKLVVVNSQDLANEVFSSVLEKVSNKTFESLAPKQKMIALSGFNQYHKRSKRCIMMSSLGAAAQERHQKLREEGVEKMVKRIYAAIKKDPFKEVNFRDIFLPELFSIALKQTIGVDVDSVYVEEFGREVSKSEMLKILVTDTIRIALEIDWREFFPYLGWVPNWSLEAPAAGIRRAAVTKALIRDQKKRIASGQKIDCYLDFLLQEEEERMSEDEIETLIFESILETSDTTFITSEWALYEISKDPVSQEAIYSEIKEVCGSRKLTEEHFLKTPYLNAVMREALRLHPAVPILPFRYSDEDITIGGFDIPARTKVTVNVHACNMDENHWDKPEEWKPERFFNVNYNPIELHRSISFGGGKRRCAGILQAKHIFCLAIGRFIQEFEWELKGDEEDSSNATQMTNGKLYPLLAYIKPRKSTCL